MRGNLLGGSGMVSTFVNIIFDSSGDTPDYTHISGAVNFTGDRRPRSGSFVLATHVMAVRVLTGRMTETT